MQAKLKILRFAKVVLETPFFRTTVSFDELDEIEQAINYNSKFRCHTEMRDDVIELPDQKIEVGDWVKFNDSTSGVVYLVVGLLISNCVKLNGMYASVDARLLEVVRKNNKP